MPRKGNKAKPSATYGLSDLIFISGLALCTLWILKLRFHDFNRAHIQTGLTSQEDNIPAETNEDILSDSNRQIEDTTTQEAKAPDLLHSEEWILRQRRRERLRADAADLPPLDGLPVFPKRLDHSDIFINQENYFRLMEQYNETLVNLRSFPTKDMHVLTRYKLDTCAVVGNSGSLLNSSFGTAIDSHDTVVRINQAPIVPPTPMGQTPQKGNENVWRRHVGHKTTFRLVNTRWATKYGDKRFLEGGPWHDDLPLEREVTIIVTRARPHAYDQMAQYMRTTRVDVRMLYLSSRVIHHARQLLVEYRAKLDEVGRGPYFGGDTPSSGYVALYMLMLLCNHVTAYGFGLDSENGKNQEYHYFHLYSPAHSKKKNSMNRTHSFEAEKELLRALHKAGHITLCGYTPGKKNDNHRCGLQKKSKEQTEAFSELDNFGVRPEKRAAPRAKQEDERWRHRRRRRG